MKENTGRASLWEKLKSNSLLMRIIPLAIMLIVTVSAVATVFAATKNVSVTIDGNTSAGATTVSCENQEDAHEILEYMGHEIPSDSEVLFTQEENSDISITVRTPRQVDIAADGKETAVQVLWNDTVADALKKAGKAPDANDELSCKENDKVLEDMAVEITRRYAVTVTADGVDHEALLYEGDAAAALRAVGIELGEEDFLDIPQDTQITDGMQFSVSRVTYKTVITEKKIDYESVEREDDTIYIGEEKVESEGEEGLLHIHTRYKYIDGEKVGSEVIAEEVVKEPVDRVTLIGTKEKPKPKPVLSSYSIKESNGTLYDQSGNALSYSKVITGRCAAYTGGGWCSTGVPAAVGRVAVNPNIIPYGTRMYICSDNYVYGYAVAADTGGACMNGIILIDLYMDTSSQCGNFGVRNMRVYFLD